MESMRVAAVNAVLPLVAWLCSGTLCAQRTLVVDRATGPYYEVSAAVAASRPGDRIEVHPGQYSAVTISHGLDVYAPQGARVAVSVLSLAPHHAVRLEGLNGELRVADCAGPVHVHRGQCLQPTGRSLVTRSAAVVLSHTQLSGGLSVVFADSNVFATNLTFGYAFPSEPVLQITRTTLYLIDTRIVGFDGISNYFCNTFPPTPGQSAIVGDGVVVAAGSTELVGGLGGQCYSNGNQNAPSGAACFGPQLRQGPNVTTLRVVSPPPVMIAEPPRITAPASGVRGTSPAVSVVGEPAAVVLLALDLWHAHTPFPGSEMPLLLVPASALLVGVDVANGSGEASFPLPIPNVPWVEDWFVVTQAASFDALGLRLSRPGFTRIH